MRAQLVEIPLPLRGMVVPSGQYIGVLYRTLKEGLRE